MGPSSSPSSFPCGRGNGALGLGARDLGFQLNRGWNPGSSCCSEKPAAPGGCPFLAETLVWPFPLPSLVSSAEIEVVEADESQSAPHPHCGLPLQAFSGSWGGNDRGVINPL